MRALSSPVLVIGVCMAMGCGGPSATTAPALLEPPKTKDGFEGVQCNALRPPTEPDLMGWDPGSRLNLKQLQERGIVAVRYKAEGCNVELEVLNCVGKGEYTFSPYSATETKVARSQRDLFAELPIGAARLGGKVGGGRALRTDYMLAGVLATPVMRSFAAHRLDGDCERATHVVSKVYIGGFAMTAGLSEKVSARASAFGAGIGGESDASAERVATEGNADACAKAQQEGKQEKTCNAPLRIGLTPIERLPCPKGTALQGSACVTVTPEKPDLDHDGVADDDDVCPDIPQGTKAGFRGCPDLYFPVKVLAVGRRLYVPMPGDIAFARDSAALTPQAKHIIGQVAEVWVTEAELCTGRFSSKPSSVPFRVRYMFVGHASGGERDPDMLSAKRAAAVRAEWVADVEKLREKRQRTKRELVSCDTPIAVSAGVAEPLADAELSRLGMAGGPERDQWVGLAVVFGKSD